jgi:GntR family transcriptional regulator
VPAPADIADRLRIEPGSAVVAHHHVFLAGDQPIRLAVSYLPLELVRGTGLTRPDRGGGDLYARLNEILAARRPGGRLNRFREEVSTRMPAPDEAAALQLADGVPLIRVLCTAYDEEDAPIEVRDMVLASDRYQLVYALPAE